MLLKVAGIAEVGSTVGRGRSRSEDMACGRPGKGVGE